MPLVVSLFTEDELPIFTALAIASFKRGLGRLLTGPDTPENIKKHEAKTLKAWREDPNVRLIKCIDEDTGEVVGAAKWVGEVYSFLCL
jgi:hypothetical protein